MPDKPAEQKILVPVDFSAYSEAALLMACEMARCMKLPLVILHVMHDPSVMPGYYAKMKKKKNYHRKGLSKSIRYNNAHIGCRYYKPLLRLAD